MKKFGFITIALAVLLVGSFGMAQLPFTGVGTFIEAVNDYTINDENPLILIKYVGTAVSGTVDINTNALELFSGANGAEAAATDGGSLDVNIGDVCGTAASALDVTDTECDTFGELVDVINANTSDHNWVAVLVGAAPGDAIAAATDFVDPADKLCKQVGGCALYPDGSVHDETALFFAPWLNGVFDGVSAGLENKHSIEPFLTKTAGNQAQRLRGNPVPDDYVPCLTGWMINQNGTGAGVLSIMSQHYGDRNDGINSFLAGDGTPTTSLLYQIATADDTELLSSVNRIVNPICGPPGTTLLIRGTGYTALTDTDDELQVQGFYFQR